VPIPRPTGSRNGPATGSLVPGLITLFFVLAGVAWLMATPPGSSFDERAHYVKAIGVGQGQFLGEPLKVSQEDLGKFLLSGARGDPNVGEFLAPSSPGRWQLRTSRQFEIRPALLDLNFGCTTGKRNESAACLDTPRPPNRRGVLGTYVGTYQPFVYLPAGLAIRTADAPQAALRAGRAGILVVAVGLLVTAAWLLWSPAAPGLSLLGLVVAVTPMVVFVSSVLSPSGPEIAGAVCFSAGLLRLVRQEPAPRFLWAALAASGAILVALALVSVALLVGPGVLVGAVRAAGGRAIAAGVVIVGAAATSLIWEFTLQPRPSPSGTSVMDAVRPSIDRLLHLGPELIGVFGALDAPMPGAGHLAWLALLVVLAGAALVVGDRRERLSVPGVLAAAVAVTLVMSVVYREIGPLHARYVLPFLVLVPLWLGEVVLRGRGRLPERARSTLVVGGFVVAGAVHMLAWWSSARRFAVGVHGDWLFPEAAAWSPPLGWWTWVLMMTAAVSAFLVAGGHSMMPATRADGRRGQPRRRSTA
jgi:hypothetical protein